MLVSRHFAIITGQKTPQGLPIFWSPLGDKGGVIRGFRVSYDSSICETGWRSNRIDEILATILYQERSRSMEHVENLLKTNLEEIERLLNTKTVVGEPIKVEGVTLIPLISIGFGFGAGGGSGQAQKPGVGEGEGAVTAGGGGIKPVAVVVISDDGVRVESIKGRTANIIEKIGSALGAATRRPQEKSEKSA